MVLTIAVRTAVRLGRERSVHRSEAGPLLPRLALVLYCWRCPRNTWSYVERGCSGHCDAGRNAASGRH